MSSERQLPAEEYDEEGDSESSVPKSAPKKRGRPKNEPEGQNQGPRRPGRPKSSMNKGKFTEAEQTYLRKRREYAARYPIITADQLPQIIGPCETPSFGANWTKADEDHQKRVWSEALSAISDITAQNHSSLMTTWKLCYRLYKISPIGLLSPLRGLCYLPSSEEQIQTSAVIWNTSFCRDLNRILTHGELIGDVGFVVTLLQYAVICRTDDRRVWQMPTSSIEGGPMMRLRTTLQSLQGPSPVPIWQLHDEACAASPQPIHCVLSNVMCEIVMAVRESQDSSKTPQIYNCNGFAVYAVSPVDVRNILTAIDNSVLEYAEVAYRDLLGHLKTDRDMPNSEQLASHMRRALLHEAREMDKLLGVCL
ncbi:hypothetical protein NW752_005844 [Fusarium irregulare]|nr:hypothetical protein NW752_005844 [Fusarium irregulare]